MLAQTEAYFVCGSVHNCVKRRRRCEREFAVVPANLHAKRHWFGNAKLEDAATLVTVPLDSDKQGLNYLEKLASGGCKSRCKSSFTLGAASEETKPSQDRFLLPLIRICQNEITVASNLTLQSRRDQGKGLAWKNASPSGGGIQRQS